MPDTRHRAGNKIDQVPYLQAAFIALQRQTVNHNQIDVFQVVIKFCEGEQSGRGVRRECWQEGIEPSVTWPLCHLALCVTSIHNYRTPWYSSVCPSTQIHDLSCHWPGVTIPASHCTTHPIYYVLGQSKLAA